MADQSYRYDNHHLQNPNRSGAYQGRQHVHEAPISTSAGSYYGVQASAPSVAYPSNDFQLNSFGEQRQSHTAGPNLEWHGSESSTNSQSVSHGTETYGTSAVQSNGRTESVSAYGTSALGNLAYASSLDYSQESLNRQTQIGTYPPYYGRTSPAYSNGTTQYRPHYDSVQVEERAVNDVHSRKTSPVTHTASPSQRVVNLDVDASNGRAAFNLPAPTPLYPQQLTHYPAPLISRADSGTSAATWMTAKHKSQASLLEQYATPYKPQVNPDTGITPLGRKKVSATRRTSTPFSSEVQSSRTLPPPAVYTPEAIPATESVTSIGGSFDGQHQQVRTEIPTRAILPQNPPAGPNRLKQPTRTRTPAKVGQQYPYGTAEAGPSHPPPAAHSSAAPRMPAVDEIQSAEPSRKEDLPAQSLTVNPNQIYNGYHEYQKQIEAADAEHARLLAKKEAEEAAGRLAAESASARQVARENALLGSQTRTQVAPGGAVVRPPKLPGSISQTRTVSAPKPAQAAVTAPVKDAAMAAMEDEMRAMVEKMREYQNKDPKLFANVWESVKKTQQLKPVPSPTISGASTTKQHAVDAPVSSVAPQATITNPPREAQETLNIDEALQNPFASLSTGDPNLAQSSRPATSAKVPKAKSIRVRPSAAQRKCRAAEKAVEMQAVIVEQQAKRHEAAQEATAKTFSAEKVNDVPVPTASAVPVTPTSAPSILPPERRSSSILPNNNIPPVTGLRGIQTAPKAPPSLAASSIPPILPPKFSSSSTSHYNINRPVTESQNLNISPKAPDFVAPASTPPILPPKKSSSSALRDKTTQHVAEVQNPQIGPETPVSVAHASVPPNTASSITAPSNNASPSTESHGVVTPKAHSGATRVGDGPAGGPVRNKAAYHRPGTTPVIWQKEFRPIMAALAAKILNKLPDNRGKTISPSLIEALFDVNRSYVEICEMIESRGFKMDRGLMAKALLSVLTKDDLPAQQMSSDAQKPNSASAQAQASVAPISHLHISPAAAIRPFEALKSTRPNPLSSPKIVPKPSTQRASAETNTIAATYDQNQVPANMVPSKSRTPRGPYQKTRDKTALQNHGFGVGSSSRVSRREDITVAPNSLIDPQLQGQQPPLMGSFRVSGPARETHPPKENQSSQQRSFMGNAGTEKLAFGLSTPYTSPYAPGYTNPLITAAVIAPQISVGKVSGSGFFTQPTTPIQPGGPPASVVASVKTVNETPLTKAMAARKRTFAEIMGLTANNVINSIEDDDEDERPAKLLPLLAKRGEDNKPEAAALSTSLNLFPQQPQLQQPSIHLLEATSLVPNIGVNASLKTPPTLTENIPKLSPINPFRDFVDIVNPIDRSLALRRSHYNPSTVARDVLITSSKHPHLSGLNAHLRALKDNFSSVDDFSDLSTFRWSIVDPGGITKTSNMPPLAMHSKVQRSSFKPIRSGHGRQILPPRASHLRHEVTEPIEVLDDDDDDEIVILEEAPRLSHTPVQPPRKPGRPRKQDEVSNGMAKSGMEPDEGARRQSGRPKRPPPDAAIDLHVSAKKPRGRPPRKATASETPVPSPAVATPKRRGRPIGWRKDRDMKPKSLLKSSSDIRPSQPILLPFVCKWANCHRQLQNLDTLCAHVLTIHAGKASNKSKFNCKWLKCEDPTSYNYQGFINHFEEHVSAVQYDIGEGPRASSLAPSFHSRKSYLEDGNGRQITPSIDGQSVHRQDPMAIHSGTLPVDNKINRKGVMKNEEAMIKRLIEMEKDTDPLLHARYGTNFMEDLDENGKPWLLDTISDAPPMIRALTAEDSVSKYLRFLADNKK